MRKLNQSVLAGLAATTLLCAASGARADDDRNSFKARLIGFQETPAISSTGRGEFTARVRGDEIDWELTYEGLEGTPTTAAHVHFGQTSVAGGVSFFLCGGGGRPACTPTSGNFSGTATAADIIGPTPQGIAPTEIAELIRAMRAGKTYANVHTGKHPGGEIRGQLRAHGEDD
ncbi:MAG TPA: CHRD domain-containing protein [Burkholderiales bacterium]|nr:CHRD domain-containing protein [Burkholderiales bacterium]